jgi:hypothetical protein
VTETKDILAGETCELIAAQAMDTGYKAEWKLTLRYEGHTFTVKAFAEHERLFKAAGFYLPDRLQGERKYLVPYSVVVELDPKRNQRRVVAIFNQYGEIRKLEDYLERPKAEAAAPKEDDEKDRRIRALEGELQALRNSIANGSIATKQSPLEALKSALDALFVQYPEGSTQRSLISMMLMNLPHLANNAPLVAASKKKTYAKGK